jgi:hypothetical protein
MKGDDVARVKTAEWTGNRKNKTRNRQNEWVHRSCLYGNGPPGSGGNYPWNNP